METEIRDRKHTQIEHNETVVKSKYENDRYWLGSTIKNT